MRTHDGFHDGTHDDCYGCKLKHVNIGEGVFATRSPSKTLRPMADPSWEKGIAGEHRAGGGFMPYLDEKLAPIRVKRFGEHRTKYETIRKDQLATNP